MIRAAGAIEWREARDAEWETLVTRFRDRNYCQDLAYARAAADDAGARVEFLVGERDGAAAVAAAVRIKRAPLIGGGVAHISNGPLLRPVEGPAAAIGDVLASLRERYVAQQGLTLRLAPTIAEAGRHDEWVSAASARGAVPAAWPKPYRTIVVDLTRSEEEARAALHQKWRHALKRAEASAAVVRWSDSAAALDEFAGMLARVEEAKGFDAAIQPSRLARVNGAISEASARFRVGLVEHDGANVAGIVVSVLGDTMVYLLGATPAEGRRINAANLLQWDAMRQARAAGARVYDLGGIDAEENPGVHRFKARMGGREALAPGPYEFRPAGPRARLVGVAERCYRGLRDRRERST